MSTTWQLAFSQPKPKKVRYIRSIVSYVDVLGFRELIAERKPGEVSRILRILAEAVKPLASVDSRKVRFTKFSDTVIRSTPENLLYPLNFIMELRHLVYAQMALIPLGVLARGVITVGDVVQSWGVVYGPAVITAYDLERMTKAPVIRVDATALAQIRPALIEQGLAPELNELISNDGDTMFLNYLRACESELNVPEQEFAIFLELHRDFIRNGLQTHASNVPVLRKYEWLGAYHDRTISDLTQARDDIRGSLRV